MDDKQTRLLLETVAEGEWLWPGRLSSHLAGSLAPDPFGWRALIDEALDARLIKWGGPGERIQIMSAEDVEARQEAMKFADAHTPMALETPARPCQDGTPVQMKFAEVKTEMTSEHVNGCHPPGQEIPRAENLDPQPTPQPAPEPAPKRKRRSAEEVAAGKAAKEAARAMAKLHAEALRVDAARTKAIEREAAKVAKAQEREAAKAERKRIQAQAKIDAKLAKIAEAEGGTVELPAVVMRNGYVGHVSDQDAWAVIEMYLGFLCVDCETSGYPIGHKLYELRTVQLGGEEAAIVFDASDPGQMSIVALALDMAVKLSAYSAIADVIPLVNAGAISWQEIWAKMYDAVFNAKLTDPKMSGSDADALKELSVQVLGDYAISRDAEIAKNALFKAMGCLTDTKLTTEPERNGWLQVNRNSVVMTRYAGSDVLDLAAVIRVLPPIPVSQAVVEREREFQDSCARVNLDGMALDHQHILRKIDEEEAAKAQALQDVLVLSNGKIINPKSPDVIKLIPELFPDVKMPINRKSKNESADKESLEKLCRDYPADVYPERFYLFKRILAYRHHDTTLGLLLRPLQILCEHGDSRMRPTVYTIEASTGRTSCRRPNGQQFCYSSSSELLTDKGFVPFPEIRETHHVAQWLPDGSIEFVTPTAVVHEPYDGPMIRISGEHHEQVVTPNHRVYSLSRRGNVIVESAEEWLGPEGIVDRKLVRGGWHRTGQRLAEEELLDLRRAVAIQADGSVSTGERDYIDFGVTKKRKADRLAEFGWEVRHTAYCSGGKRVYRAKAHETPGILRWLSLPDKNFRVEELLKLDAADLREFIAEIMLWDGDSTRGKEYSQAKERSASVETVELAAVLCGYSTTRREKPAAGQMYDCVNLFPKTERWASRTRGDEVPSDGMVHCVEVPSGAVVTRSPSGKVIVSGNSRQGGVRACVVADPGFLGISADFEGCEIRVAAALSGDRGLYEAEISSFCYLCKEDPCACGEQHIGLHWRTAHGAHPKTATKEHRYQAKRGTFTRLFGGGAETAAAQVGCPVRDMEAIFESFNVNAPDFTAWDNWMRDCYKAGSMVWRDYAKGENYSVPIDGANRMIYQTYTGRNIYINNGAHAAGNGAIQGTARELLVDGTLVWRKTRWGGYALLPIHDQIFTFVPEGEAAEATAALAAAMQTDVLSSPGFPIHIGADVDVPFTAWPDSS